MRINTKIATIAFLMSVSAGTMSAKSFSYIENFDDVTDGSKYADLPEGWVSEDATVPFYRYDGKYITGEDAHSGSYVLATAQGDNRDSWVFGSKLSLKAGVKYTVKFWLRMPGGAAPVFNNNVATYICSAQSKSAQVAKLGETGRTKYADWTEVSYEYTPDADGDYYIGFNTITPMYSSNYIAFDDLQVTGEEPDSGDGGGGGTVTPDPGTDQPGGGEATDTEIALSENFDNDADFADSNIPAGWKVQGDCTFSRNKASYWGLTPHSGEYVFGANGSTSYYRQDAFYTKGVALKAGVEYTLSFWYYAPGGTTKVNPDYYATNIITKVGTEQDASTMLIKLGETTKEFMTDWKQAEYKFTPEVDGDYYFAFILDAALSNAGAVGVDDIQITSAKQSGGGTDTPDPEPNPDQPGGDVAETEQMWIVDFDNDEDFADGGKVPAGWVSKGAQPLERNKASYYGQDAHSGGYIFGTLANMSANRNEEVYTSKVTMKAGSEYTLKFWYKAPGNYNQDAFATQITAKVGTAQNAESMTATLGQTPKKCQGEWTEAEFKYTPDADGDYYFGLSLSSDMSAAGFVGIDDVEVLGPKQTGGDVDPDDPEPELPDGVVCELPYSQSFDNENGDYDGTTFVPAGWLATGSSPFVTTNMDALEAADGEWYLLSSESNVQRDDRIYTPFFKMTKGTTYTTSFYLYMPGDIEAGNAGDISFTVGTEQDSEFHTALLTKTAYTNSKWEEVKVDFTPEKTDYYCFSFALGGEPYSGEVGIDLFKVTAPGMVARPKAAFSFNAPFNIMNSNLISFEGTSVQMVNQSTDADSYHWEVAGAVPESSDEMNPSFEFPQSGDYKIKLTVKNVKGENTTSETVSVTKFDDEVDQLPINPNNPNEDKKIGRDYMECYDTAADADYVTGVNHYYRKIAEKYTLPEGREYFINSLNLYLSYYQLASGHYNEQANAPFSVVVYADKDGKPDMENIYGRYDTTVSNVFGTSGIALAEFRSIALPEPIVAKGPFYVALEFDNTFRIDEEDTHLSRSIFAMSGFKHRSKVTTFYALPEALPETATCQTGSYVPVHEIDAQYEGYGLDLIPWISVHTNGTATSIALTPDGQIAFASMLNGNQLTVSGTHEGETVTLLNMAGQVVSRTAATDMSTQLSVGNLPNGVYMVSTPAGTLKFMKK